MILVINASPAVDRVAVVNFREKQTLRPERLSIWAGGSGIHAGYVARLLGAEVHIVGFVGGHTGAILREALARQGLQAELVAMAGETRQTFSLLDVQAGNLCDVVEPAPEVQANVAAQFERLVLAHIPKAELVVISGSIPAGCSPDLAESLIAAARRHGVPCIADVAGDVLRATLAARPWLIKPSRSEVSALLGVDTLDLPDAARVARQWVAGGVEHVCVSLDAQGLLWVSSSGAWHLHAPAVAPFNSIGCGDTLVGAVAATYVKTGNLREALRAGVAAAAANLRYDAPGYCTPEDVVSLVDQVTVSAVDM